ncbi:hypothetical protein MATR_09710 [Marivirga tractuosa]|uniref:Peptidase S74 domain-containing protein n=1 Tax=Marivirga tractuosa (strain ATCC 23168 / DSM 4126 / NBRC 15989 / NCIMB 1408 / VKM B-1430 / H-43) TaxID=643867 RepID=E4TMW9_MARTH|nr:tail fiber domain-containing protein [Marivirga tractuosa]ADR21400.1 hypothetical protein Ftrac_1410 [Marivirga tractuosa DSM 4126]BDD14146.1 hypothetical protein MATR_09710 [Marivirga tractuosa]
MKKLYITLALNFIVLISFSQKLPFQGYLEESGVPVNGTRTFNFELTDYGWSETIANVPIDNGIYNVVLGEITLLPDTLFSNLNETSLNITVDSTNIGSVTLYKPLVNGQSLLGNEAPLIVKGPNGETKAELNYFANNNAGSLVLNGANDSTKVILGSAAGGYGGFLGLYDSLRNIGAQLRVTNKGRGNLYTYNENHNNVGWFGGIGNDGFSQLVSYDSTGTLSGALLLGSFADGIYPEVYLEGAAQANFGLGRFRVIQLPGGEETTQLEINRSNGGGQARLQISQDNGGADPTGVSGTLDLFGDSSPNFLFGSASWEDHDLANMSAYGSIPDGTGWYYSALDLGASKTGDGSQEYGFLNFHNNQNGNSYNTVSISGNLYESSAGGIDLKDSLGTTTAILEARGNGNSGQLKLRGNNGLDIAAVQNRGGNSGQAVFYGNDSGLKAEIGSFGDNSGFLITYGQNGNKNVQLDRDPGNTDLGQLTLFGVDGITPRVFATSGTDGLNEWGSITLDSPTEQIILDGQTSTITATTITASSDRRLKKNISTLENSLANTLRLRGTTYYWKNENSSTERQIGLIAQEVEEVYPEFVHTDAEGKKSVNYSQMTAVLIEAIKELNAKVVELEKENDTLTSALNETMELSKKIDKLEKLLLNDQKVASN